LPFFFLFLKKNCVALKHTYTLKEKNKSVPKFYFEKRKK